MEIFATMTHIVAVSNVAENLMSIEILVDIYRDFFGGNQ